MQIDLDKSGLKSLVKGSAPNYQEWGNPLVKKAGFSYDDTYGRVDWAKLDSLTEEELYQLYLICTNSWTK